MYTFMSLLYIAIIVFTIVLSVNTFKEMWKEIIKPGMKELKDMTLEWFWNTDFGIWYFNKKQGVTIISEKEYHNLVEKGVKVINIK